MPQQQGQYSLSDAKPIGQFSLADAQPAAAAPTPRTWMDSVKDYASEAFSGINPVSMAKGGYQIVSNLGGVTNAALQSQAAVEQKAADAFKRGDYAEGVRHTLNYLLPLIGPRLDQAGDYMQQGQYAKGLGATTDVALQTMGPEAAGQLVKAIPRPALKPANPDVAAAVQFGANRGVPLDAATATDNAAVRATQHLSDRLTGGAQSAAKAIQRQRAGLATVGEDLASQVHPVPVSAEQAGAATAAGLESRASGFGVQANTSYGNLRAIEAKTPIPIDLTAAKAAIEPAYAELSAGADIAPLQGSKATAARAMARILNAPDVAGASVVDSALSDLKRIQREASGPGTQAINMAVDQVEQAVTKGVTAAGPDAIKALTEGRAATKAKYAAQDVLDTLKAEPVKTTEGLTLPKDRAIEGLRAVAKETPEALPQIGRSVLDGLMTDPTVGADAAFAKWNQLGTQTKMMLYKDPAYITDLDRFFLLSKKIAQNANISGSGHIAATAAQGAEALHGISSLIFHGDPTGIAAVAGSIGGSAGLSTLLHSDAGVRLLTQGILLPPSAAARGVWLAKVQNFIRATQVGTAAAQPAGAGGSE